MKRTIYSVLLFLFVVSAFCDLSAQKKTVKNTVVSQAQDLPMAKLSEDDKRKFDYYFHEAMNAKATSKFDSAFDLLGYCLAIDSTNANVYYELGNYYNSLDNKNKALDFYRKATSYDGGNFYYNMAYASLCLEFKQYSDAIEQFEKLLVSNPDNSDLYVYLSEAYRLDGNIH